ncbi:alpha/beta hydrolase [Erysipelothrix tonsillarum]|uniref:alpha/beta hydrolase n=1 Tax=Erysipelothrix tonsillarum TaxID=38402 RepID=UPI00035D8B6F|nr:alpha/beta hydrolase [Erysipelothrix tonsillarum]
MKHLKRIVVFVGILVVLLGFAGGYFFKLALVPGEKDFIDADIKTVWKPDQEWLKSVDKESKELVSDSGLKLKAWYVPAKTKTKDTILVAHGYGNNKDRVGHYIRLFHEMGFNVLAPDARSHGESEGNIIGFGWPERFDIEAWVQNIISQNGNDSRIALFGLSMGASTVMMASGLDLPDNVMAVIEDCGYTSVADQLSYKLKDMYNLPAFPMIPITSLITQVKAGFNFYEASAVESLKRSTLPTLFIHGDADDFVPFEMLETLYQAHPSPKEKIVIKGANHAESYEKDPVYYKKTIESFLSRYLTSTSDNS